MKRLLRLYHGSEKGFTLIELLIVVAILGILAAVIVPNLIGFIGTGKVAAANTEVANVESAALAYYGDHDGVFPPGGSDDLVPPATYLSDATVYADYTIDDWGKVDGVSAKAAADGLEWCTDVHKWAKTGQCPGAAAP
jgi:prepilin-type N-terminal cleavage/methylation domain-containing protein